MLESRSERDLTLEPLDRHLARHLRGEHLHHDLPAQRSIGGHVHVRHATTTQLAIELVVVAE